jgi:threonine dehydratase
MRLAWAELKQTIEPSSAVVLAALLAQRHHFAGQRVGLVLSGGNVDLEALPFGARNFPTASLSGGSAVATRHLCRVF